MEIVKGKRAVLRTSFTRTVNILKEETRKDVVDRGILHDKLAKLEGLISELKVLDQNVLDALLEQNLDETQINNEFENAEQYSDQFITIKRVVNEKLSEVNTKNKVEDRELSMAAKGKCYKLPKIEIVKFDGEIINYLSFWSQFKKIHEDEDLENSDKFQYLLQSMKPGTRARELIESYPITSDNYSKAVNALQMRFGNKELLVEVYVRELLKLIVSNVRANGKDRLPLCKLFDKVEAHLRALESMGIDSDANSAWLYPMVESSLSEDIIRAWQRSPLACSDSDSDTKSRLSMLMKFLRREVEGEEKLSLAKSGFDQIVVKEGVKDKQRKREVYIPTAAGLFAGKELNCIFCDKAHESKDCLSTRYLSLEEKIAKVRSKRCCLKCLKPGHISKLCKSFVRCHICRKGHLVLLCPELPFHKDTDKKTKPPDKGNPTEFVQSTIAQEGCTKEVSLMTLDVELKGKYLFKKVRALFDCGSQRSYVLKSTAKELGLEPMDTENIAHLLFGGSRTEPSLHNKYNIELRGSGRTLMVPLKFEFLDQEIICGDIPRLPKVPLLKELKKYKIWLSDVGPGSPKIEILIGSDIYGKLLTGHVQQLSGGLTAIQTKLGWTVCGKEDNHMDHDINTSRVFLTSLAVREFNISDLWKLDTIGILDPGESLTKASEDEFAQEQFLQSLNREEDGRYCVGLPWLGNQKDIPSNRHIAEKRLFSVTRRLKSINKFEDYNQVFQEWLEEGVIEKVPEPELEAKGHYLPHHPIIKADSVTTKIRPVFDASCKVDRMPSLNDCLVKGPNLIEEIPAILLRFREKKIGVVSDIRRAFLQISLQKEDRDHLRFLWWESLHKVQTFRHNRVVFGVTCSPFLLGAVIQYHLSKVPEELKPTAEKLLKSFYVDNCVTSVDSETELNYFVTKATEILAEAKMDLRMWEFGPLEKSRIPTQFVASDDIREEVPVLGLRWDKTDDSLMFSYKFETRTKNPTKRDILSLTQGIFDPIGVLTPVLLPAKLLIQQAWAEKANWDSPLPKDIEKNFIRWYESLYVLTDFRFPRRIGFGENFNWSLQVFCDASQSAYATVIFLRCANDVISVKLVGARSRLSPLKRMTIPRLELMACILGARLAKFIAEALSLSDVVIRYWTDSTTALAWIQRNDQWGTFVGNRVREICKLTNPDQWSYVPGTKNPADLPSRGCSSRQFLESRWWEGPDWLKSNEEDWESMENAPDEEIVALERRKGTTVNLIGKVESTKWYERISKFSRIVRVLAWVRRFIKNTQLKNVSKEENLSVEETQDSENALWKIVQKESFSDSDNAIKGLLVMRDADGLIRVKTKIIEREDTFSFRYPILLPGKHHVITSLITEYHKKNCHAGVQILSAKLRETYWIIASRRNIRNVVTKCVTCKRFSAKSQTTPPIHLPLDRVRDASVFEIVGIDLCGPLYLKNKNKTWIVLFTCV